MGKWDVVGVPSYEGIRCRVRTLVCRQSALSGVEIMSHIQGAQALYYFNVSSSGMPPSNYGAPQAGGGDAQIIGLLTYPKDKVVDVTSTRLRHTSSWQ